MADTDPWAEAKESISEAIGCLVPMLVFLGTIAAIWVANWLIGHMP